MADIDALLGTGTGGTGPLSEPAQEPKLKRAKKATTRPHVVDETVTGPTPAEAKAAQTAAIAAAVDELANLWSEIEAGATCPSPERVDETVTEESPDRVARIWTQRFEDESNRRALFGCNAAVQVRVTGTGVTIRAEIKPGMDAAVSIARFQEKAVAMGNGAYTGWLDAGARGPHGGQVIMLNRAVVGADPATAFRAVNHNAYQIYADENQRRQALWFNAGLAVQKIDRRFKQKPKPTFRYEFPAIIETIADAGRGPSFVVEMHREQGVEDFEAALPKLRALLRVDLNLVERRPGVVELQLLHRKEASWPATTPLSPKQLWRPRSKAESLIAARDGVLLPVGVTRDGKPLMIDLRRRPHLLLSGTSGAGKSTLFQLMLRAVQVQLGPLGKMLLTDAKGADMRQVYGAGVGQNLSVETASIHRAITYAYDEMERRKVIYKRLIGRGLPDKFPVLIICIDEFGAFAAQGLASGATKAAKAGMDAALIKLRHVLKQGRSLGVHVLLSTQDVTVESGINTNLLSVISSRIVVGQVQGGSGSALDKLFLQSERQRVAEAGAHIKPGDMGMGVMVDEDGNPTAFKAFYNAGAAADAMSAAVAASNRERRFAWQFPHDGGLWLNRTCADTDDLPSVDSIPVIPLEDEHGYIAANARYDEGNAVEHDPGSPPLNDAHGY
ncbi:FtsK/SpoIIIE domain-containing protein [Mycobacteroides abscessus]|uniref:FtsK/SpoIIIE domain-containing protein n=1 Tax=Mycobacteroides abscessus TaxID=36809 RepID=UPI000927C95A|nr:FtsK/SpoIIIE domain-containing protein [Mycobacteroides abscessus]SIN36472.1 ftsk/SpoIIIE family protein, putative [Mycobacteroides abscessus subsp. abscessus]